MGAENAFRAVTQRIGNRARQGLSRAGNKLGLQGPHPIRSFYTNKDISPFTKAIMTPGLGLGVAVGEPIALGFKGVRKGAELGKRLANTEVAKRLNPLSEAKRQARHDRNLGKKIENSTQEAGDVLRNLAKAPLDDAGVPTLTRTEPSAPAADLPAPDPRIENLGEQAQLTPDGAQVTPDGAVDALGADIQRLMDAGNSEEQAKAILANNALQAANNTPSGENAANATASTEPASTTDATTSPQGQDLRTAADMVGADGVIDVPADAIRDDPTSAAQQPAGQTATSEPIHIDATRPADTTPARTQDADTFTAAQTHTADPGNVHHATPAPRQTFDASVPGNASGSPDTPTNGNSPGSADTAPATSTPDASGDSAVDTDAGTTPATGTDNPDATASSTSTPDTTTVDPKESLRAPLREDLKAAKYALDHLDRTKPDFVTVRDNLRAEIRNLGRELDYVDFPEHRKRDMIEDYRSMRGRLAHAKSSEEAAGMLADANELRDKIIDLDARGLPGVDIARAARGVIDGMPNSSRFRKFDFRKRDMNRFGKELRWMQKGLQGDMDALKRLAYMPPDIIDMSADKEMVKLLRRIHQQNMAPQSFGEFAGNLAQKIFNRKNYKAKYAERARLAAADQATALTASPEELDKIQRKYGKKIPWWMNILLTVGMAITAEVINDIGPAAFQDASGRQ